MTAVETHAEPDAEFDTPGATSAPLSRQPVRHLPPFSMYARGRHGWTALTLLAIYPIVGYWLMFRSYEFGNSFIGRNDFVSAIFVVAIAMAWAPRIPTWEHNARPAIKTWTAVSVALTVAVFAVEPILIRLAIFRLPEGLRPDLGTIVIDPNEWATWTTFALNNVVLVSLVLIGTALLGRVIGPLVGLAVTVGLGLLASAGLSPAYGLNLLGEELHEPWFVAVTLALAAVIVGHNTGGAGAWSQLLDSRHRRF